MSRNTKCISRTKTSLSDSGESKEMTIADSIQNATNARKQHFTRERPRLRSFDLCTICIGRLFGRPRGTDLCVLYMIITSNGREIGAHPPIVEMCDGVVHLARDDRRRSETAACCNMSPQHMQEAAGNDNGQRKTPGRASGTRRVRFNLHRLYNKHRYARARLLFGLTSVNAECSLSNCARALIVNVRMCTRTPARCYVVFQLCLSRERV